MAEMTKERQGEIAMAILESKLESDGGFLIGPRLRREMGDLAKKTNVPIEELDEFSKILLTRQIGKAYGVRSVSLTLSDPIKAS